MPSGLPVDTGRSVPAALLVVAAAATALARRGRYAALAASASRAGRRGRDDSPDMAPLTRMGSHRVSP
ncbi:hypothetical protein [Streptomyces chryseus]